MYVFGLRRCGWCLGGIYISYCNNEINLVFVRKNIQSEVNNEKNSKLSVISNT